MRLGRSAQTLAEPPRRRCPVVWIAPVVPPGAHRGLGACPPSHLPPACGHRVHCVVRHVATLPQEGRLRERLTTNPLAAVGEVGLDRSAHGLATPIGEAASRPLPNKAGDARLTATLLPLRLRQRNRRRFSARSCCSPRSSVALSRCVTASGAAAPSLAPVSAAFPTRLGLQTHTRIASQVHCVHAPGALSAIVRELAPFPAGLLLHGFSGSADSARELAGVQGFAARHTAHRLSPGALRLNPRLYFDNREAQALGRTSRSTPPSRG